MRRPLRPAIVLVIALVLSTGAGVGLRTAATDHHAAVASHAVDHRPVAPSAAPATFLAVLAAAVVVAGGTLRRRAPRTGTGPFRRARAAGGASLRAPPAAA
jgi:hypothetical protein